MNVIAGILIGIANDEWIARLIVSFAWGIVFVIYASIFRQQNRDTFIAQNLGRRAMWGMSSGVAFYFVEFMTAVITSMIFSVLAGIVRTVFSH